MVDTAGNVVRPVSGSWRRRAGLAPALAVVALVLAGCVSGAANAESATPTGTPAQTEQAQGSRTGAAVQPGGYWKPAQGLTWQVQLSGTPDLSVPADVYDIDGRDNTAATVSALKAHGHRAVCYINAGAYEDWRPDASAFPAKVIGREMDGWPGERWLDIRRQDVLLPLMARRLDDCAAKGFDAVDPDNVQGYGQQTGFPLSQGDAASYVRALARLAHERGLAFGLKNAPEILDQVSDVVDFAVNEQCHEFQECDAYDDFLAAGKPVVVIEYTGRPADVCRKVPKGMYVMFKELSLNAVRGTC